jgi:hypothetical protein
MVGTIDGDWVEYFRCDGVRHYARDNIGELEGMD